MFERKKYKNFAKTQLSGRWGVPVVVSLVVIIILKIFSLPDVLQLYKNGYFTAIMNLDYLALAEAAQASNTSLLTSLISCSVSALIYSLKCHALQSL